MMPGAPCGTEDAGLGGPRCESHLARSSPATRSRDAGWPTACPVKSSFGHVSGRIRATLGEYLNDWTTMARAGVAEARRLLREVLVDRIVFRPVPRPPDLPPVKGPGRRARLVYEFTGEASLSKVFADLIYVSPMVAPTGFEPVFETGGMSGRDPLSPPPTEPPRSSRDPGAGTPARRGEGAGRGRCGRGRSFLPR